MTLLNLGSVSGDTKIAFASLDGTTDGRQISYVKVGESKDAPTITVCRTSEEFDDVEKLEGSASCVNN